MEFFVAFCHPAPELTPSTPVLFGFTELLYTLSASAVASERQLLVREVKPLPSSMGWLP